MDEKELMELSEEIIDSLTKLILGESPGFLSNNVFKKLNSNKNFDEIKSLYSSFIVSSCLIISFSNNGFKNDNGCLSCNIL